MLKLARCLLAAALIWLLLLGVSGFCQEVSPHLRPVIAQSDRDGLLLGLDFRLTFGPWELGAGGAWGFASQAARFRTHVQYLRALGLSYGDWPQSLVLGRQGEQGIRLTTDLIAINRLLGGEEGVLAEILRRSQLRGTGFQGKLWPGEGEDEGPEVRYLHLKGLIHLPLPFGISLETRGEFLFGQPLEAPERSFQTFFSSSRLWVDQTTLELRLGELDNPADLAGFRFNLGLRSYPAAFAGERFLLASIEQRFEVLSRHLFRLDLSGILGPEWGWIPVHLRVLSSVFFEGGVVFGEGDRQDMILFGWGTSLIFPDLELRVDLAVNREGLPQLTVETGVLP